MKKYIILTLILTLTSCTSYVERMHSQIDKESGIQRVRKEDQFDVFRKNKKTKRRVSSLQNRNLIPTNKKRYDTIAQRPKRLTTDDLNDNEGDGSLWAANNANAFLFTTDTSKRAGDIILINVQTKLKDDITTTLKRFFPPQRNDTAAAKADAPAEEKEQDKTAKTPEAPKDSNEETNINSQDRISSVVVEEINKEHLLIRGRKSVLYHGYKRTVEVQALVARRDITTEDSINSDSILETNVNIVR